MNNTFRFRRTTIFIFGLIAFLAGLGVARVGKTLPMEWVILSVVLAAVTFKQRRLPALLAFVLLGLCLGMVRGQNFLNELAPYETLYGEKVIVQIKADTDAVYGYNGQLEFDGSKAVFDEPEELSLPGTLKVSGYGEPAIYRGDVVLVEGKLYPYGGSRKGSIRYSEFKIIGRSTSELEKARREFVAGMETALPEPHASFALGLLVGQRTTLPDNVEEQLSVVGLTHIIAVSGYNLTIIVRGVRRLLGKRSKYQATLIAIILIALFLLVTGFSASIVRASIVSVLSLLAWYHGRVFRPMLILLLSAAITAGWYPVYLWSDIGWYLSFLAFYGVLIFAPLITKRVFKHHKPRVFFPIMIESFCAQLLTAPLVLYIFERASIISLASNLVVVPLVPVAMLFSLFAGVAGIFMPILSGLVALPAFIVLTYMLDVVNLFSRVPGASIDRTLSLFSMIFLYVIIVFVTLVMWRKVASKRGIILDTDTI